MNKKNKIHLVFVILLYLSAYSFSQNLITEYSNYECSHSKQIVVPFGKPNNTGENIVPVTIHQTVFYELPDQFSYWYRIPILEDGIISCKVTPINPDDQYVIYVYKYNKSDFCNKVFYGKINPLRNKAFLNNTDGKESFEMSEFSLKTKKDEAYFVCVLNISPSNCGHNMRLIAGIDTFNIKAIHLPCTDEEPTAAKPLKTNSNVDSIVENLSSEKKYQVVTINVVEENNKSKKVDARLRIKDELTGNNVEVLSTSTKNYTMQIEKGRFYKIEALATGYKKFDHSIIISEYVHPDSNRFDIFLRPMKPGENFVMDNIYFFPNTYALKQESEKEITYLYTFLSNNPEIKIELEGHTNGNNKIGRNRAYKNKGPEWNFKGSSKKLSNYRAEAIKKMLVKKGIAEDRIKTIGYGGERMIISNAASPEALKKNIRVEVKIL